MTNRASRRRPSKEQSELLVDSKHPLILPRRHALTRLVLNEHYLVGHPRPSYVVIKTRQQRFWIVRGISIVKKRYLSYCAECVRRKTTPIHQFTADLLVVGLPLQTNLSRFPVVTT